VTTVLIKIAGDDCGRCLWVDGHFSPRAGDPLWDAESRCTELIGLLRRAESGEWDAMGLSPEELAKAISTSIESANLPVDRGAYEIELPAPFASALGLDEDFLPLPEWLDRFPGEQQSK
jgi:hypothetical protein